MATGRAKVNLAIGICLLAFAAYAQNQSEQFEPKLEVEIRPPIVKVEPIHHGVTVIKGPCDLTEHQRDVAWKNVLEAITKQYPEFSKYCEMSSKPSTKTFMVVNGACHARIKCAKTVDGVDVLKNFLIVEVDETTLEVLEITGVP